ncbi:MAG: 4Fe-4S dicluster domain-containing protein [Anaerolineales bacterium]|jgi:formate hydrogenlyase subunit 6/NADH:ubiquinone oxidoreductase subunit I
MLDDVISELKEVVFCLRAGQVTLGYPFRPHSPEPGFRGVPHLDMEKCIGCGACANACPSRLITLSDHDSYRTVEFNLIRCTNCARCRDVCPEGAVTMSQQFETAAPSLGDLRISLQLKLVRCRECGAAIETQRMARKVLEKIPESLGLSPQEVSWLDLCIPCKRLQALHDPVLAKDVTS